MTTIQKLEKLRLQMRRVGVQAYLIPTDDYHASEYVGEYFKVREYVSGFSGSAGTLVVLEEKAALFTDGRYFLQAKAELKGSGITLMKSGNPGVPSIEEYLAGELSEGDSIGYDGRVVSRIFADKLREACKCKHILLRGEFDLVDSFWTDRPMIKTDKIWEQHISYAGSSREEKLSDLREEIEAAGADAFLITVLDEIAWLLNLRGSDIAYTPVFLSYLLVERERATLCVHRECVSAELEQRLLADGVTLASYDSIEKVICGLPKNSRLLLDESRISARLSEVAKEHVSLIYGKSPILYKKAIKTPCEIAHIRQAHIKDGVAVTRFIYWLKHNVGKERITELSAAEKLEEFRRQQEDYLYESFAPIIAYGPHGAIVHYEATKESSVTLEPHGFCLADTGGHYLDGTTDITRTIALGELTEKERHAFTMVLKGHINLALARFPEGVCGQNLDILARMPLWQEGYDFNHGTGHGVGFLLDVHEGPQKIHWRIRREQEIVPFSEGMITSDEPGLYLEGEFGIRHENLLLCVKEQENEQASFLHFEPLTLVPFDRDAIDVKLLTRQQLGALNAYHAHVFRELAPLFSGEELSWLRGECSPL